MESHADVVAVRSNGAVSIQVELLDSVHIQGRAQRLVQQLNGNNDISVLGSAVLVGHVVENLEGQFDIVALLPGENIALARIVETVLRAGGTVQVHQNLETSGTGPLNGLVEVCFLALNVGVVSKTGKGPVANGDSYVVETILGHGEKVILSVPSIPVLLEPLVGLVLAKVLAVVVFINGSV